MAPHQFKLGQKVVSHSPHLPPGPYVVVALLPPVSGQPHYRVKSVTDGHLRAMLEAQITAIQSTSDTQDGPK
jgi:hypothetical protein